MKPVRPRPVRETPPAEASRWPDVTLALVALLIGFAAFNYGAVEAWSEAVVIGLAGLVAASLVARCFLDPGFDPPRTWLWAPLLGFAALVALQAAPLGSGFVRALSPTSVDRRVELTDRADPDAVAASVSYYPPATSRALRLLLVGGAVFAAAASASDRRSIERILMAGFVLGLSQAALALSQAFGVTQTVLATHAGANGSFINHSNFCQFVNLALGSGLGLLLSRLERGQGHRTRRHAGSVSKKISRHGWLLAATTLMALAVFTSMSRGGVLSMAVAAAITVALYGRTGSSRKAWLLALAPLALFAALTVYGFDLVYDRVSSAGDSETITDRWGLAGATLDVWRDHPLVGVGLGTHRFVFPAYDKTGQSSLAEQADNDYAQLLEETGLVGAGLVAAFIAGVGWLLVRLMRDNRSSLNAAAYGLGFGLIAVMVHSFTDYGQRLPAIFSMSALVTGLVVALSRRQRRLDGSAPAARANPGAVIAIGAVLTAAWGAALVSAVAATRAETAWASAYDLEQRLRDQQWAGDDEAYADLLIAADEATVLAPGDVEYAYWLNVYRWESISRGGGARGDLGLPSEAEPVVERIADELVANRALCPTFGPPYGLEGSLRLFVLQDESGAGLIERGYSLARHNSQLAMLAAYAAARRGDTELSRSRFSEAVGLDPTWFEEAATTLAVQLGSPQAAEGLAAGDLGRMRFLRGLYLDNEALADRAAAFSETYRGALLDKVEAGDASLDEVTEAANLYRRDGDFDRAVLLYRRVIAAKYASVSARIRLIECLEEAGRFGEALEEARVALRINRSSNRARQIAERLTLKIDPDGDSLFIQP